MPLLICEGACNPRLPVIDALLRTQSIYGKVDNSPVADTALVMAQRSLRYTQHRSVTETVYADTLFACSLCGRRRQFGGDYVNLGPEAS